MTCEVRQNAHQIIHLAIAFTASDQPLPLQSCISFALMKSLSSITTSERCCTRQNRIGTLEMTPS